MLVPWLLAPGLTVKIYLLVVLITTPVCFALYGIDKRRAIRQRRRISEETLLLAAFVGGWPGAWLGQRVFHHKIRKRSFRFLFWLIVAVHVGFIIIALIGFTVR